MQATMCQQQQQEPHSQHSASTFCGAFDIRLKGNPKHRNDFDGNRIAKMVCELFNSADDLLIFFPEFQFSRTLEVLRLI